MAFGIAVLGLDHWYTAFGVLDIAASSMFTPLVGVWDMDPDRRDEVRRRYPNILVTDDSDLLLSREDVFLTAICAATNHAPNLAREALSFGKHVVSVKPPARNLVELDDLGSFAREQDRFYGSFEGMQRLHPRTQMLRELIRDGAIGTPMAYHQIAHGRLPAPWPGVTGDSWWLRPVQTPGGAWIDHAIYAVDLARYIFEGEITVSGGIIENRVHRELEVEDYGISLMRLAPNRGGASVSLIFENTWTADAGGSVHQQQIIGTLGSIQPEGEDWVVRSGGIEKRHPIPAAPFFQLEILAELIQTGQPVPFGFADTRANLAACLAVYESARRTSAIPRAYPSR